MNDNDAVQTGQGKRASGILLHPTSLPGRYGIGDLGDAAYSFADFLAGSGVGIWQVLPLGPPGFGNSPYQSYSSMAGNPLLISPDALAMEGLLAAEDLAAAPVLDQDRVDYDTAAAVKWGLLRKASANFMAGEPGPLRSEFAGFCEREKGWLDAFAEFAALKELNGGVGWTGWSAYSGAEPGELLTQKFVQFLFFRQWEALRKYCNTIGIRIMGDLPIFVAHDSADVWANPALFDLDGGGLPKTVAGVPPDYFSETGQRWGNPLYRWDVMEETGYRWWIERMRASLRQADLVRLDHFRGFEKFYEIPGGAVNALKGRWVEGPGDRFFAAMAKALGGLPFIAEDLGLITPEVLALRERWQLPGMRVLQFAFVNESADDPFKPHNFVRNCVVYTGTHDNDTTLGWFRDTDSKSTTRTREEAEAERRRALAYLDSDGSEIHWDFIRAAVSSVADTAIFPLQDVLGLGSEARMNVPARAANNWRWRFREEMLEPGVGRRLLELNRLYGRAPERLQ